MKVLAIYTWLAAHHCTLACAAAIIGHAQVEVGKKLDPCTQTNLYAGLFQWGFERKKKLFATYQQDWCKLENQLGFMLKELKQMDLYDPLFSAKDVDEAALLFQEFEGGKGVGKRVSYARAMYSELSRQTVNNVVSKKHKNAIEFCAGTYCVGS